MNSMEALFHVEDVGDDTINVRNVPVFRAHFDRNYVCDEAWLDRCVADHLAQKMDSVKEYGVDPKYAMLPPITLGHTPEDPNAPEPPSVGFVDNLRRLGKTLYADFMAVPRSVYAQMKEGKWPYRSAEVIPSKFRLTNVSLLGGRYPHFALPVMRFQLNGLERVRYVMSGSETQKHMHGMIQPGDMTHHGGYQNGAPPMADSGPPPEPVGMGGGEIEQLAYQLAPMIAQILSENEANQPSNTMMGQAAYIHRHDESTDAAKHASDTADAFEEDKVNTTADEESVSFGSDEAGKKKENFGGSGVQNDTMKMAEKDDVAKYVAELRRHSEQQNAEIERLTAHVAELQQHNVKTAQAAKRQMLTSKCKELAALGYAIGDTERIARHVERMLTMPAEDVKDYIEDVLKTAPKVTTTVERHGVSDFIARPGAPVDENERYYAENSEHLDSMGLDKQTLELADILGG